MAQVGFCSVLPHGTFEWSYATFLFPSAAQAHMATAREAVAWTFQMDEHAYAPMQET